MPPQDVKVGDPIEIPTADELGNSSKWPVDRLKKLVRAHGMNPAPQKDGVRDERTGRQVLVDLLVKHADEKEDDGVTCKCKHVHSLKTLCSLERLLAVENPKLGAALVLEEGDDFNAEWINALWLRAQEHGKHNPLFKLHIRAPCVCVRGGG